MSGWECLWLNFSYRILGEGYGSVDTFLVALGIEVNLLFFVRSSDQFCRSSIFC